MNTQTHVLLAVAIVGSIAHRLTTTKTGESNPSVDVFQQRHVHIAVIVGALLPDLSLFVMFGYAKLTGVPNAIIWSEMYYADFWQWLGAISNSIPVYLALSILSTLNLRSTVSSQTQKDAVPTSLGLDKKNVLTYTVLAISLAALAHCLTDLPLHHDDGHPHFWPISNWIYSSPVSYWDVRHHAAFWVPIECLVGLFLVVVLWRRNPKRWIKGLLALAAASYALLTTFFFLI